MIDFVIKNGVLEKYTGNETKVVIPDSVTEIGDNAFSGCKSLKEITIPDSVIDIGERAFEGCESLTSITIPDSVTEIYDETFKGCRSLKEIIIPDSVTEIGDKVFSGCEDLVIKAPENSFAQKYAEENGMKFKVINR